MICIILVAGHGARLEADIRSDTSGQYTLLKGVPKALLPGTVGSKKILDYWWHIVNVRQIFSEVYLVTNADKYKYFERWATASGFPVENIINDGTTTIETSLGAVADFELVLHHKKIDENVVVVAGDMLFEDENFDMQQVVQFFNHKQGDLVIYYEMNEKDDKSTRGIIEVDQRTNRILKFFEKPDPGVTDSLLATVVFYCFRQSTLKSVSQYLQDNTTANERTFGKFISWLVSDLKTEVYGMKLPTRFQLIGQVGLPDYEERMKYFTNQKDNTRKSAITCRAYARIGLMGNPSDGFYGKTISLSIANFWADATIQESDSLVLCPHPLNDPTTFGSLKDLHGISRKEGYLGGLRLLQATCKKFYQYCCENGIALYKRNFTLSYDTNIPRQVGLAGSSAIVTATLTCLMKFYNLTDSDLPKPIRANLILNVETDELRINAGLQDRVVQVFQGLVYMDFSKDIMTKHGHGVYEKLTVSKLPDMFLAYLAESSDSGKIHSNIRQRFDSGDEIVTDGMKLFGKLTEDAKAAIQAYDIARLRELMDDNFNLRRRLYGDDCIGENMLKMIKMARDFGASAKFPGSGGAVVGIYPDDEETIVKMKKAMSSEGYVVCNIIPYLK